MAQYEEDCRMNIEDFIQSITHPGSPRGAYVVLLKYKYDCESEYTYSVEFLDYDAMIDDFCWLNDWDEGQTDVYVVNKKLLSDLFTFEKAEWIEDGYSGAPNACSYCGYENDKRTPFCPYCGSLMENATEERSAYK